MPTAKEPAPTRMKVVAHDAATFQQIAELLVNNGITIHTANAKRRTFSTGPLNNYLVNSLLDLHALVQIERKWTLEDVMRGQDVSGLD